MTTLPPAAPARRRGPVDPRLLRHARAARAGIGGLALIGAGQAAATLLLAIGLTAVVAGSRTTGLALVVLVHPVRAALTWAEQVVAQRTAARATDELRRSALAAALGHGPAWVARYGSGRLTAALTTGLESLRAWFAGYLPAVILGVALPPLVVVAMALVDPASAVITVLTLPLVPVLGALIGWATQARAQQRWAEDARLAGHFLDVVRGLATLRIFGRAERQTTVIAAMTGEHRSATMRVLRVAFLSSTALDLLGTLAVGVIAVGAGLRVAAGDMQLAPALLVILLAPEAYRPLREAAGRYHASAAASAVITDIDETLTGTLPPPPADGVAGEGGPGVWAAGLRVRHPGAGRDALRLDALTVAGGEIVALRGVSGGGKTTALRVLAGVQPVDAGVVEVRGPEPVYLPQSPVLPHARVVGDVAGPAALRAVGLDGELTPRTPLGEHGGGVSAGQRQRLALAAALEAARGGARVLLLDEPTAHLDAESELRVIDELRAAATRGCAVLVVAHRPALLAAADRVVDVVPPPGPGATRAAPAAAKSSESGPQERHPRSGWRSDGPLGVGAVALGAGSWLAGIVLTGAAAWLLVRATAMPPVLTLSAAVVLVRGSAVARPLLRYAERLVAHRVAFARLGARRAAVYGGLIPHVPGPRVRRRGELLTRVVDDVDADVDGLLRAVFPASAAAVTAAVAVGVVAAVQPVAALPLATGLLIAGVAAPLLGVRLEARREKTTEDARAALRDAVVETVDGLEELRGAGALRVPEERSRRLARQEARAAREAGLAAAVAHLGWGVAVAGAALVLVPGGELSREWAAVLLLGIVALAEPVGTLPDAALAHRRATAARRRLADVTGGVAAGGTAAERDGVPRDGSVAVCGVSAGWDGTAVLRDLSLELPAGSRTAVLGASGSGKSTLAAVIARFLEPLGGRVFVGGVELGRVPEQVLRRHVVLVGDGTEHVFAASVRENLLLAKPAADDGELAAALHRVGLDLDLGTRLGTGGANLSGGQRKRLATARALLADPPVLILDEPTEGLDAPGAEALMADVLDAASGRTVLVLTHRTDGLHRVPRERVHVMTETGELRQRDQVAGANAAG